MLNKVVGSPEGLGYRRSLKARKLTFTGFLYMGMNMYVVYLLYSQAFDRFYIGQTEDLKRRLKQHNDGEVKSTRPYRPWSIVYTETFPTRSQAMKREHFLKKQRNKKFYRMVSYRAY